MRVWGGLCGEEFWVCVPVLLSFVLIPRNYKCYEMRICVLSVSMNMCLWSVSWK